MKEVVFSTATELSDPDLLELRREIYAELNRRFPATHGKQRILQVTDRQATFEINLAEVEAEALLGALDGIAFELIHRAEVFLPLCREFAAAADDALVDSMHGLSDQQIESLVAILEVLDRIAEVASHVQEERAKNEGNEGEVSA